MKSLTVLLGMVAVAIAGETFAITNGDLDGEAHPYVGLMIGKNAQGRMAQRCSGTLMSPTLFLVAGHCTAPPVASVEIWFQSDVQSGIPGNGYPLTGQYSGTPYTHPQYGQGGFFRYDVGVVVLNAPVPTQAIGNYGALPQLDAIDQLAKRRGLQNVLFTAVGYGAQYVNPVFVESARVRMYSTPHLIQINGGLVGDYSLLLSNNHATGGMCYGDSGGPNFIGTSNVVGGITSFGLNGNCRGVGGVTRVDRADALNWLATFGLFPPQ